MTTAAKLKDTGRIDFTEALREHQSMVFSTAYHVLHDRPAAEELAQDVFLQLYKSLDDLKSPEHVAYWLRRVTVNRCIDSRRRLRLMPRIGLDQVAEPAAPAMPGDPFLSGRLQRLVASLPENWRALVILRYQEDLENEEIARVLDMPVGTVKSQLSRALDFLREKAFRVLGET
jgi:RNA polymerase sigma-70 factor (ECF subfamily)